MTQKRKRQDVEQNTLRIRGRRVQKFVEIFVLHCFFEYPRYLFLKILAFFTKENFR